MPMICIVKYYKTFLVSSDAVAGHQGVPRLIIEQPQVSAPLSSQPVAAYRKGGAAPRACGLCA